MVVTVEQMKRLEKKTVELGSSYLQLMEQAGSAAANLLVERYFLIGKQVVILTGSGNNGGDGYVIARKLMQRGAQVTVVLCKGMPSTQESQENFRRLDRREIRVLDAEKQPNLSYQALREGDFLVDCIFGTGFRGAVRGTALEVLNQANRCGGVKVAVDLPSGLSGDSGEVAGEFFHADLTIALGEKKPVHVTMPAAGGCGEIVTVDIGIPKAAYEGIETHHGQLTKELFARLGLPLVREAESNKGTYGKLLLICGSVGMGGAALMATRAALRCGAGLVKLATVEQNLFAAYPHFPEAVTIPLKAGEDGTISKAEIPRLLEEAKQAGAVVFGCGLNQSPALEELLRQLLEHCTAPLLIDADGINLLAKHIEWLNHRRGPVILTPHPGEMARLCGKTIAQIQQDREQTALSFVREYPVVLVLKGHKTLVYDPAGWLWENTTGNPGMARGGSGDVLAGMIGSFLVQPGYTPGQAAAFGVYLHGLAGDLAAAKYSQYAMLPTDLIEALPEAFLSILS